MKAGNYDYYDIEVKYNDEENKKPFLVEVLDEDHFGTIASRDFDDVELQDLLGAEDYQKLKDGETEFVITNYDYADHFN